MKDLLKNTRLSVYTYNSTGYLEAFGSDLPVIVFWDPVACPVRGSAIPYFEDLKRVGLLHESPESAAEHVAAVWDDVGGWWTSAGVRAVLPRFTDRYCRTPTDLLPRTEAGLREMVGAEGVNFQSIKASLDLPTKTKARNARIFRAMTSIARLCLIITTTRWRNSAKEPRIEGRTCVTPYWTIAAIVSWASCISIQIEQARLH